MSLTEELRKLSGLHQEGHLTDQEFADAKRRLISDSKSEVSDSGSEEESDDEEITEMTYKSSRWSSGNMFFPDRLTISNDGILFRKGALIGSSEELINYKAVASVRVENRLYLSNITIETAGGSQPIYINGLWKSEAKEIQASIRARQGKTKN